MRPLNLKDTFHTPYWNNVLTELHKKRIGLNEDAMKIMEEASTIVEESMKDKFPDLPSTTTMQTNKTEASLF